jgi:hypothetical protein
VLSALVVIVLVAAFALVAGVAGLAVHRIWTGSRRPGQPGQQEE